MYRPQIKVIDCTIRDGGLMNDSHFSKKTVRNVYKALNESGIDIIELGYRNSKKLFPPDQFGIWRFTPDEALREIMDGIEPKTKLAVMMDAHKADSDDLKPKEQSPVDMVRVATYVKDIDKAIKIVNDAHSKGYETAINIMAISHSIEWELEEALHQIEEETKVAACYIVDSFGALYSEDIDYYIKKYQKYLHTKEVGVHCHNHMQLGFANTIEGIIKGANYLDATIFGLGRAAGNCPLELLISFLKNPKFDILPVFDVISTEILPMQKEMQWGYHIPYMIAGILDIHPEQAMEYIKNEKDPDKINYKKFYQKCLETY